MPTQEVRSARISLLYNRHVATHRAVFCATPRAASPRIRDVPTRRPDSLRRHVLNYAVTRKAYIYIASTRCDISRIESPFSPTLSPPTAHAPKVRHRRGALQIPGTPYKVRKLQNCKGGTAARLYIYS